MKWLNKLNSLGKTHTKQIMIYSGRNTKGKGGRGLGFNLNHFAKKSTRTKDMQDK